MANKILRQITVFILMLTMVAAAIPSAAFAEEVTVSGGEETVATSAGSGEKADTQKDDSEDPQKELKRSGLPAGRHNVR